VAGEVAVAVAVAGKAREGNNQQKLLSRRQCACGLNIRVTFFSSELFLGSYFVGLVEQKKGKLSHFRVLLLLFLPFQNFWKLPL